MAIIDLSKERDQSLWVGVGQITPQWQQTVETWSGEKKSDNLRGESNFVFVCLFFSIVTQRQRSDWMKRTAKAKGFPPDCV